MCKITKKILCWMIVGVIFCLTGCGGKSNLAGPIGEKSNQIESTEEYKYLDETELVWKDNSRDNWQAVFNLPIEEAKMEGEYLSKAWYYAGEHGALRFKNHFGVIPRDGWSGVNGFNTEGKPFSTQIIVNDDKTGVQIDYLGPIAGGTGYVACNQDGERTGKDGQEYIVHGYWFYTLDENFEKVNSFYIEEDFKRNIYSMVGDSYGNVHMFLSGVNTYIVVSPQGEKLLEAKLDIGFTPEFSMFEDGRIVLCVSYCKNGNQLAGWKVLEADLDKKTIIEHSDVPVEAVADKVSLSSPVPPLIMAKSEHELILCDREGIKFYNVKDAQTELVYKWSRHGISVKEILNAYSKEDGTVGVIYKDAEGVQYLLLKPTFEEVEPKTVYFAVSPRHWDIYYNAVAAFNKKYPTYNIEMKSDYEEIPLLTQLGSGEGPVIIDTSITGFEALEKLWQPLDGYLENTGLVDELYPQAIRLGQIGDSTYGVVTNFYMETLVAKDWSLIGWDYDTYLDAVENFDGLVFTYEYVFEPTDFRYDFFKSLSNGLNDSAFLDTEKGTVVFGTPAFRRILTLAEKANPCLPAEDGKTLQEGKALCEKVIVDNVVRLVNLRLRLENSDIVNVGYPTKNGAKPLLIADPPITIRSTATEEEKKIAYTFFKILLSHDGAMELAANNVALYSGKFSVRKEILEEQFDQHNRIHEYNGDPEIDKIKERELFERLLENAVVKKTFPADLQSVFDEEFAEYLKGVIPTDLLDSRLRSRVGLYLDEK